MGNSSELLIKINADIKDFDKKLSQVQKRTESLNESLNKAGLIAGASFVALTAVTFKAVEQFKDAEKSSILLENAMRTQGVYSDKLIDSYKKMAKELEGIVNIDDDTIIAGQAVLQRFIGQKEISKELTLQTINLAKAQGIDLNSAFALVGKTIAGEMNPLARQLAISIDTSATATEKMNQVTEALKNKLDGVAEAMARAEGPLGKLKIAFGNLEEGIGKNLKPLFDGVANALYQITSAIEKSDNAMGAIASLIATGLSLAGFTILVIGAVKAFVALEAVAVTLGVTMTVLTGGIVLASVAVGGLIFAMSALARSGAPKTIDEASKKVAELTKKLEELKKRDPKGLDFSGELHRTSQMLKVAQKDLENFQKAKESAGNGGKALSESDALAKEKEAQRAKERADEIKKANEKIVADAKELYKKLIDAGKTEEQALSDKYDREIELADNAQKVLLAKDNLSGKERAEIIRHTADLKIEIEKDYKDKYIDLIVEQHDKEIELEKEKIALVEKLKKESYDRINAGASNPFSFAEQFSKIDRDRKAGETDADIQKKRNEVMLGSGAGLLNEVSNGKQGAQKLVTEAGALAVDAFAPGVGQALKPLIGALTAGPEATKAFVKEFTDAIPDLIQGLIEAIPVFIEELANQTPVIIERLVDKLPEIIEALVHAMPRVAVALALESPRIMIALAKESPKMAIALIEALIKEAPRFVTEMVKAIAKAVGKFFGGIGDALGIGGGGGGIEGAGIGSVIGSVVAGPVGAVIGAVGGFFAEGGQGFAKNVPSGFPNDSFRAQLTSGELVVDRSTASGLREFIDRENRGGGADINTAMLSKIIDLLGKPLEISTQVSLKEKAFADIILVLNRNNARLS